MFNLPVRTSPPFAVIVTSSIDQAVDNLQDIKTSSRHPTIVLLDLDQHFSLETLQHLVDLISKEALDVVPVGMHACMIVLEERAGGLSLT